MSSEGMAVHDMGADTPSFQLAQSDLHGSKSWCPGTELRNEQQISAVRCRTTLLWQSESHLQCDISSFIRHMGASNEIIRVCWTSSTEHDCVACLPVCRAGDNQVVAASQELGLEDIVMVTRVIHELETSCTPFQASGSRGRTVMLCMLC